MPTLDLAFNSPINISCKEGDVAYFVNTFASAEFTVAGQTNLIGTIESITIGSTTTTLTIEIEGEFAEFVTTNDFVFFSKNNIVEVGSIVGYYAKAKFKNNSTKRAELHESACEIEESSK
tara:strand:- start:9980 stop:10339 length:360 start_codon:yes stop_codon:yes gene_type:complete